MAVARSPLSWLRDYVDVTLGANQVAQLLTLAGIETEVHDPRAEEWERIWVGRIARLERHPNADKLQLATVEYGRLKKTVVTGASNLTEGDIVPYAEVGARLIDGRTGQPATLEPKTIRGVRSEGMVCSERELGLGDDHEGILLLDRGLRVGAPLADVLGEPVLVSELRPNRPDCLGVLGIAREVAALLDLEVREPALDHLPHREPRDFAVTIDDPAGCPRYTATFLRKVRVAPSPRWLADRLVAAGMRPINNVVDVTNYVMLETGQPLHAFDRRRLRGSAIRIRRAESGERLRTLDGEDRLLEPWMLAIADAERAIALAGIIGGADAEIAEDTTDVVLEVANFENRGIGRTATALRVQTESGKRFSWELSPYLVPVAQRRAVRLLRELAGAESPEALDRYSEPREPVNIRLPFDRIARLLGVQLAREDVLDALRRVGCQYAEAGDTLVVTPPPWRTDLVIPEDVIEEAARVIGYERIPTRLPSGPLPLHERHRLEEFRERLRDVLVGLGLQEIVSYPLIDPAWLERLTPDGARAGPEPLRVTNPTTVEQSVVRTTLEPSLLEIARRNLRVLAGVALFEIGAVHLPRANDLPEERWGVGIVLAGRRDEAPRYRLAGETGAFDLADLRGIIDGALAAVRVEVPEPEATADGLHPGRSAELRLDDRVALRYGQLHPLVAERWELPAETFVATLDLASLAEREMPASGELPPRYPAAMRDLAVVVDETTAWRAVRDEVTQAAGKRLDALTLLDVYRGQQIPAGRKSFAMRLALRAEEGTLAEAEIERLLRRVTGRLSQALGATIRE